MNIFSVFLASLKTILDRRNFLKLATNSETCTREEKNQELVGASMHFPSRTSIYNVNYKYGAPTVNYSFEALMFTYITWNPLK